MWIRLLLLIHVVVAPAAAIHVTAAVAVQHASSLVSKSEAKAKAEAARAAVTPAETHNTAALGLLIYDQYFLLFQLAGLILLVAMVGAIVLTLRHRKHVKRQDVLAQMYRDPATAMELKDVKPGQGL